MLGFEVCHELDAATLERILGLIRVNTEHDGHRPVGEHKYAHLQVGADGWTGVLAWSDDGELKGYAHTLWNPPDSHVRVRVEVVVHPAVRGDGEVARSLLDRTKQVLAEDGGGVMWLWVHRVADARETLAYDMGFDIQRELAFMRRGLEARPEVPSTPSDVVIAPYRPGRDDEAFLQVNNAAFSGHPENGGWDVAEFRRRTSLEWFDPEGLLMAWRSDGDGPRLLGFHWTKWHGHESEEVPAHEPVGEVYVLAVHPDEQGSGLGGLLLRSGLAHLWDAGCRQAILYVDRADRGAVRLYEKAGFSVAYSEVCYQTEVTADATEVAVSA